MPIPAAPRRRMADGPWPTGRDPKGSPCQCPADPPWTGPAEPRRPRIIGGFRIKLKKGCRGGAPSRGSSQAPFGGVWGAWYYGSRRIFPRAPDFKPRSPKIFYLAADDRDAGRWERLNRLYVDVREELVEAVGAGAGDVVEDEQRPVLGGDLLPRALDPTRVPPVARHGVPEHACVAAGDQCVDGGLREQARFDRSAGAARAEQAIRVGERAQLGLGGFDLSYRVAGLPQRARGG